MSDTSGASIADDSETRNSSDYEDLHVDKLKETVNKFLQDNDSDSNSSFGTLPKNKNDCLPNETAKDAVSSSKRTEIDMRDVASEASRESEFSKSNDARRRQYTDRSSSGSEGDSDGACCSDVSTKSRSKKSKKSIEHRQKSSYSEPKARYDNSKLLHGDKKSRLSSQSHSGREKSQHDGSSLKKHLSHRDDRKSFVNVGRQLSVSEKSFRKKVKSGSQDRRMPSKSRGAKSLAVNVRDTMSSEDSRSSEISDNSASNGSSHGVAETLSIVSRSGTERSSSCDSISSIDSNKLRRRDLKMSLSSKHKAKPDVVVSHCTKKSRASGDGSQHEARSESRDKLSHHSKSKSRDSRLDLSGKKLDRGDGAPHGNNGKKLQGCDKPIKMENVPMKTSQREGKIGTKGKTAPCKTADTDISMDGCNEILSENSRTSDLWAGFALGDWGHGRATERLSVASRSDLDEESSHCGSTASLGKVPAKEQKKSSHSEAKFQRNDKKSHNSDKSHESDKKAWPIDTSHVTDKKKSHHSGNDKSQLGGKSFNSGSKQLPGLEKQAVKDESIPNTGGLQKVSQGLSFFSGSKSTHSSPYKAQIHMSPAPIVKIASKPIRLEDSPTVLTKVKINGFRVFVDKGLRTDCKLWQLVDVALVNCDHVLAASLAKQRETTLSRKLEGNFSSMSTVSPRKGEEQKVSHKGKRENEKDVGKILAKQHTHSNDCKQRDNHSQKKSFDETQSKGGGGLKQNNNKMSTQDSNKKSTDRSESHSESRLVDIDVSSLAGDIRHKGKSHDSRKSLHESKSHSSSKSQCEIKSNSSSKLHQERNSIQDSKSQHEKESIRSSKSRHEKEYNQSSKSQCESESNQSSKSQHEKESNQSSKSQHEKESNQGSKLQHENESYQSSKSQCESESNQSNKSKIKPNGSSKSQRDGHSNHRSNSQHGSESQQSSKSHSKVKSKHSDRSIHDSKSSSLESKSLSRSVPDGNEFQNSSSRGLADKEPKMKESESQSYSRTEGNLHDKSSETSRRKVTTVVDTSAEQFKPTKKGINVLQSDSDDNDSIIDGKESAGKKEQNLFSEDSKPVHDNSKHMVADDLGGLVSDGENSKDGTLPDREEHQEPKADETTEKCRYADDDGSLHKQTTDVKQAFDDMCSTAVTNDINNGIAELIEEDLEKQSVSAKEISVPSPNDTSLELCKLEENSPVDTEDTKTKPENSRSFDLTEVDKSYVCQTACSSDMSDGNDIVDQAIHSKSELEDDLEIPIALSELNQIAFDVKGDDSVIVGQDSGSAGDCVTPRERKSSNSDNVLVPSVECASSVVSTETATKESGTEPETKVFVKVPVCARFYDLEQVKTNVRLQPFVKLKVLDASLLKKLLSDWEYSVRRKSNAASTRVVSDQDDSLPHSRSSSSTSSSGKSEMKDRCVDKIMPPTRDNEVQEKKKRNFSSADDIITAESPVRRLKVEGDTRSEVLNIDRKKESVLPETIAKSLQKAKAEFKRKGGFPSEMVRDDAKKRKTDLDKSVPSMENWMHGGRDDKKMNSLSFVIPKVKSGQKPEKVKKKKPQEEKIWLPPPAAIPVPRTPKPAPLPKTLTEEDKGRSVLAKLEDTAGERENLRWQTNDSGYRGKNAGRPSDWQPFVSAEDRKRKLGQEGTQWRNCGPGMPRDAVNGSVRFQRWNAGSNPRNPGDALLNAPRLPPPSRWQGASQSLHSITNETGGSSSSSDWVRLYNRDPLRLEDPSAADECSAAFSPPAVADDDDADIPNDRKLEIPPRKVSIDDGDNMVENVKVLAEAIQEVLVEGMISSGRRDKLVDIYAKLQRNLNLTGDATQQANASLLNAFYGPMNQALMSVAMFKDLLQHGSQPDNVPSLPPAINEVARNDFALMATRDSYHREGGRATTGYQDVDHRRLDARCNPGRGFESVARSGTPVSSLNSPRGSVTGKSDAAHGSLSLPISASGSSGSSALHGGRGFWIDPNASFMDIDERNKCSKDIDERSIWARSTTECPSTIGALHRSSIVHKPDLLLQSTTCVVTCKTVLAQERTAESSDSLTVSGSPWTDGIKTLKKVEVPKSKEVLRQETIASRIEDELQLLEMLVTIQCELGEVSPLAEAYLKEAEATSKEAEATSREAEAATSETLAADVAEPTPVPETVLNTLDNVPGGVSSTVSNSPTCAMVRSPVVEEASQDSTAQSSCKATPLQKADDDPKATSASTKSIEDRVISLARNALKPYYHKSQITSEEFKLIMRKTIAKIKVREGEELKESKVPQLINAYVESIIRRRKKVML